MAKLSGVPKTVLRFPDVDREKSAVLNRLWMLSEATGTRCRFIEWFCSEQRLLFSKTVFLRYLVHMESRHLVSLRVD